MAHIRRKFVDVHASQGSSIAAETIRRIAELCAVEKDARGKPPETRLALRKARAKPVFDDLENWLHTKRPEYRANHPWPGPFAMP